MAVGFARRRRIRVDEQIAAQQVKANVRILEQLRDRFHQMFREPFFTASIVVDSYILLGLDAEHYKPDLNTDAVAMYVKAHQMPDGRWAIGNEGYRPPLCGDSDIMQTAIAMRALQLYAPTPVKAAYDQSIQLAAAWLAKAQPKTDDDRSWRLVGLAWVGNDKGAIQKAKQELLAVQRSDGGWSDMASMDSTAYATGKALVALQIAGLPASDPAHQRGIQFLLNTQQEDGSWYVKTRALAVQPYFDNGFPYGFDQWISAAATSWATMALALAPTPRPTAASASLR